MVQVASLLIFALGLVLALIPASQEEQSCKHTSLARYRVQFKANWVESVFPKQYPTFRPHAQWSQLIGRSHNDDYKLWSKGSVSTFAFKHFAQNGKTDYLDREPQGFNGIFDAFYAPPVKRGSGHAESDFLVTGNATLVSLAVRIIPSPDWFVGIDSESLCQNGSWLTTLSIPLRPLDAGTDQGFTFTSPNWASRPREKIYQITTEFPSHRASSFHYPELDELPSIANLTFQLLDVYKFTEKISEASHHREENSVAVAAGEVSEANREKDEEAQILAGEPLPDYQKPPSTLFQSNSDAALPPVVIKGPVSKGVVSKRVVTKGSVSRSRTAFQKKSSRRNCIVTSWGSWSACSKSCGFGVKRRTRKVTQAPRRGRPCPELQEERWCGSMRNCEKKQGYFSWVKSGTKAKATDSTD